MLREKAADPLIFVVFGIPGAGKTTIARTVVEKWSVEPANLEILSLDLDDCIPQWMRDNFSQGIYPTLVQRLEFAKTCCDYVDAAINKESCAIARKLVVIVSFSFVNQDLREQFRNRFPFSRWILIDTTEQEAQKRIDQRTDHFYKGKDASQQDKPDRNDEWNFDPVPFPHTILSGHSPIEENASKIFIMMKDTVDQSAAE